MLTPSVAFELGLSSGTVSASSRWLVAFVPRPSPIEGAKMTCPAEGGVH